MPESWDLFIPNKEGKKALYRLEILMGSIAPTTISIYHRRVVQKKKKNRAGTSFASETYAFCFEYRSGNLVYVSLHNGDFANPHFRWADTRDKQFEGDNIPSTFYPQALGYIEKICDYLREKKEKAVTYKEKEKCERFLSPLERILLADKG